MVERVEKFIYDELRRDRDNWRKRAKYIEGQNAALQDQICNMRRAEHDAARRRSSLAAVVFGGRS